MAIYQRLFWPIRLAQLHGMFKTKPQFHFQTMFVLVILTRLERWKPRLLACFMRISRLRLKVLKQSWQCAASAYQAVASMSAMSRAMIFGPRYLLGHSYSVDASQNMLLLTTLTYPQVIRRHHTPTPVRWCTPTSSAAAVSERGHHEDFNSSGGWYAALHESQQLEMEGEEKPIVKLMVRLLLLTVSQACQILTFSSLTSSAHYSHCYIILVGLLLDRMM